MSLRLVPLTAEDVKERCTRETLSVDDIQSPPTTTMSGECKISRASAHVRTYITLNLPVINKLLTASISKVLGISKDDIKGLCDCTMCYDTNYEEIDYTNAVYGGNVLLNGQALERIINDFNITDEIIEILEALVACPDLQGTEYHFSYEDGLPIIGCWKLKIMDESVDLNRIQIILMKMRTVKANKERYFNRLYKLTNLYFGLDRDDSKVRQYLLDAYILRRVVVAPYAMRPKDGKRNHPLTNSYVQLFNHNNNYAALANASEVEFQSYYKTLAKHVYGITTENAWEEDNTAQAKKLKSTKPIAMELKGKEGHIRGKMIKKRQDYSGRSVVVVDPFMPLDTLGVPHHLLYKMFREYAIRHCGYKSTDILANIDDPAFNDRMIRDLEKAGIFEDVPIIMGRNPTLHKHSIQAFKIKPVEGLAVRVSPLVCPAYNMDFDGDTAWLSIPVTPDAVREVRQLMLTQENILLPKTGESTICPRMDIIYGLYMCSTSKESTGKTASYKDREELWKAIYSQEISIGDNVTVVGRGTNTAGVLAFECCFPKAIIDEIGKTETITSKSIKKYIKAIQEFNPDAFVSIINNLVELGFRTAYIYCHSVSMLNDLTPVEDFDQAYPEFHKSMEPVNQLNDYGFYDSDSYNVEFSDNLKVAMDKLKDGVYEKVGDESMFTLMAKSGARGDVKNLVQIFGSKGRVQKSDTELFNVTIEHSLRDQLTPLEGFIAANGARKGQIAKSIKTADTGYLGYLIIQATSPIVITEEDCGTTNGMTVSWERIRSYLERPNMQDRDRRDADEEADKIMSMFLKGRYTTNGEYISPNRAPSIAKERKSVKIRSPLGCSNPCCAKCYGLDPSTGRPVKVGTPVGYVAGQCLAEQSTQTTLKEFQGGGVQAASSPFEKLKSALNCSDIKMSAYLGKYTTYDPIAWADGKIICEPLTDMLMRVRIDSESTDSIVVSRAAKFKDTPVTRGEPMLAQRGEFKASEALEYWDFETVQAEYMTMLWFLFKSTVEMVPVHLEMTVASMTGHTPVITKGSDLKYGVYYTTKQLKNLGHNPTEEGLEHAILGVRTIVLEGPDFMQAMADERVTEAINKAITDCKIDSVDAPLVQTALARPIKVGTGYKGGYEW